MEHGFFETLQGNTRPAGLRILASNPLDLPFPFGHEPAMTLIPNLLATGIAAMLVGLAVAIWSAKFVDGRFGAAVLALLSILLLVVGGGFGPMSLLIAAFVSASRIHAPLKWWRFHASARIRYAIANTWLWALVSALLWVPAEFAAGQIFGIRNDRAQTLTNLNLLFSYPMLGLFALTVVAGFARKAEDLNNEAAAGVN
jgi:hypothetical protein